MPQPLIDMSGERYGRLTVIKRDGSTKQGKPLWLCLCDCGNYTHVPRKRLIHGSTISCGCYRREFSSIQHTTHGLSKHKDSKNRLYGIWTGIKDRCHNPNSKYWKRYGGRGISVCDEWRNDYMSFHNWAMLNGYSDDLTLDRRDNDKGYNPDNCRWVTYEVQENNRSDNIRYNVNGKIYTLAQLVHKDNITRNCAEKKYKEYKVDG